MQKVLITGITGFTGSHLAEFCVARGLDVYGLGLPTNDVYLNQRLTGVTEIYNVDIREQTKVRNIVNKLKPEYLFHLAGLTGNQDLQRLLEINVIGTNNVLGAARGNGTRILIPGSSAEYGSVTEDRLPISENAVLQPVGYYGVSKVSQTALALMYFRNYQSPVYVARPFNITGPGEYTRLVCSNLASQFVDIQRGTRKPVIHVGNLETKRDFIDVRDVVSGYWSILENGTPGEIYNICCGKAYSIREIVDKFSNILGRGYDIEQESSRVRAYDVPIQIGDNEKIRKHTGWQCTIDFEKTLRDLLRYHMLLSETTCI